MSLPNNPSQYEVVKAIKDLETNKVDSSALSSYLPKSGGTMTGALTSKDITLYSESGDSPRLTFQRGTLTDTYNDWSIYDTAGLLHIQQRGSGSSAWEDRATITQSGATFVGTLNAGTLQEGGTNLSNKYLGKTATATDSTKLDGQASSYYLDYNNFANTPTIPTKTSDLTNDSGYTSNTGTVTSVGAGTGLSISGTASVNPTVNVASGYKLPTTTEWNAKANASAIPTNYVTTDTAQTISGAKTLSTDLTFNASGQTQLIWKTSGTTTGFIRSGISGSEKYMISQADKHYWGSIANGNRIIFDPANKGLYSETNGNISLGRNGNRFSTAYIQNGVYDYGSIAVRGVDANANYTGYFLVAYAENIPTYQPATAKIIAEDFDTVGSCYEIDVSAYFGFDSTNNVKTYSPRVRAISSTGSDPVAFSKNNIFVVMRTTNSTAAGGTNRVEIWYRGTATYSRFKFTFLYDAGQVRTDSIVKWTKVTSTSATDKSYVSAGNIVYLDSSNQFPTFIPTASWSTNTFITSQYVAANISANSMSNMMLATLFRAFATTPNIEGYMAGDVYTAAPSSTQSSQFLARDKNGQYLGGMRVYHNTDGTIQAQLMCRSQNTANQGYVCLESASNSNPITTAGVFRFIPNVNESFDLGTSSKKWRNIYGVNVYATSDRRLKENIKDAELDCGAVIDELPIKEFNFKSDEEKKVVVGAIAQELMEILPEKYRATLVSGSEDTSYSINEGKLLYVAIGALKEERAKTKELEERLAKLEKMLGV